MELNLKGIGQEADRAGHVQALLLGNDVEGAFDLAASRPPELPRQIGGVGQEPDQHLPSIGRIGFARDPTVVDHPVKDLGSGGDRDIETVGDLANSLASAFGEQDKRLDARQRKRRTGVRVVNLQGLT